ncbi:hypothetical protein AK88_05628 [Plasmodium fragile]|uniref:Schizont-infected cell agglutination extracellular alpha domain-containing protein n=1 Tax=Plasmodium fragile TaxID=5857 RepID=A0A0D9QCK7_PLAFR|nr:uncharacterized protein AK88_05628 [Plasmodium fragile]KJP84738.1 hypothetical protein AK88_05628 [Plasmodium fragile]
MDQLLKELIKDWLKRRKISKEEDFNQGIWQDMKDMFNEFITHMNNQEDPTFETICTQGTHTNDITKEQMPLCTNIVRVISYMEERLTSAEREGREQETEREMKQKMRCIIGKVNLMALQEEYCRAQSMWAYIMKMAKTLAEAFEGQGGSKSNQCHSWDIRGLSLGGRDIEQEIRTWISESALYDGKGPLGQCTQGQSASGTVKHRTTQEIKVRIVERTQQLREKVQEIVTKVQHETADLIPSTEQSNSHGKESVAADPAAAASPATPKEPGGKTDGRKH